VDVVVPKNVMRLGDSRLPLPFTAIQKVTEVEEGNRRSGSTVSQKT